MDGVLGLVVAHMQQQDYSVDLITSLRQWGGEWLS